MDEISLALNPPPRARRAFSRLCGERNPSPVWPLASLNGCDPAILDTGDRDARGIELAYARTTALDGLPACPPGTPNGTESHFMPPMTPALSIDDGVIMYAGRFANGCGVIVNHLNGWASHYSNLSALCAIRTDLYRPREQQVRAGDVIGYVGAPAPEAFKRLYFELWRSNGARHFEPVDPRDRLSSWRFAQQIDHQTPRIPNTEHTEAA